MYKKYSYKYESGTFALTVALKILKSKKVIIPTYTCEEVLTAVLNANCKPIIVDCNEKLQIDVASVLKVINDADTIIIPHMFGIQTPVSPFRNFNLKIIEDLSQCHGLPGLGNHADIVVHSILPNEPVDVNEEEIFPVAVKLPVKLILSLKSIVAPPATDSNESAKTTPAASTLPNEPVEVTEPLTPPPTTVILLEDSSPLQEPLIPAVNDADISLFSMVLFSIISDMILVNATLYSSI